MMRVKILVRYQMREPDDASTLNWLSRKNKILNLLFVHTIYTFYVPYTGAKKGQGLLFKVA